MTREVTSQHSADNLSVNVHTEKEEENAQQSNKIKDNFHMGYGKD